MRHRLKGRKLGRNKAQRRALFANLAGSLIKHEQIKTTIAKAKDLRPIVEKMITLGKKGDLHSRRRAIAYLYDERVVRKLFDVLSERYKDRQGGYTRIIKAGNRHGDNAPIAYIEFVDKDEDAKGSFDATNHFTEEENI